MFTITHNFCPSCRVKMGPKPLHHASLQERDPQVANVGIPFHRSESPFVSCHCQCVVLAIIVSRNSFLVLCCQQGCDVLCFDVCNVILVSRDLWFCCGRRMVEMNTSIESAWSTKSISVGFVVNRDQLDELEQVTYIAPRTVNRFLYPRGVRQ